MTACIYFLSYTQLHNLWEQVAFIQNKFTNDTDLWEWRGWWHQSDDIHQPRRTCTCATEMQTRQEKKTRLTVGEIGGGRARDRWHSVSVRRGTLSHSSSSRNTDAVAPELPRPCPDEPTDDAAGVSSVECSSSQLSATARSTWWADGGGGGGRPDDVLVFVLDDDEFCFSATYIKHTSHHQLFCRAGVPGDLCRD